MISFNRQLLFKFLVPIFILLLSIIIVEVVLQILIPKHSFSTELNVNVRVGKHFVADSELGYRPTFSMNNEKSRYRGDFGTLKNNYKADAKTNRTKLLFVGDSVTHRAKIVNALKQRLGESNFEFWNAGVEGYNTEQELILYKKWNHKIEADRVILTLHHNDYQSMKIYLYDKNNKLVSTRSDKDFPIQSMVNTDLRILQLIQRIKFHQAPKLTKVARIRKVKQHLKEFKEILIRSNTKFTVLVLPLLHANSTEEQISRKWQHSASLKLLNELSIEYVDLKPALRKAHSHNIDVQQKPGDTWHPSDAVSEYFADAILKHLIF